MNNSLNQTGRGDTRPSDDAEIDQPGDGPGDGPGQEQHATGQEQASFPNPPGVLTIVPAPRPYAYRRPTGHPEEDEPEHPLRRSSDFAPQK